MGSVRRPVSIRARLALIYTALLAAALIAFGTGVFLVLRAQLIASFDGRLLSNAEHAAGAFAQDVDASGRFGPSPRLVEQLASTGGRVVVLDARRTVLADSAAPGTASLPLSDEVLAAAEQHAHVVREVTVADDTIRMTVEAVFGSAGALVGFVAWADSTRPLRDLLGTVSVALVLGGLLLIGLALAGGLILARRALSPVAEVTDTARAIALSGDFAARVEAGRPGDEVSELAIAFNEMLTALAQNHQALQRFLGDVSHQLRTPLTTIRANLDLIKRDDVPAEERQAILSDARAEAERMGRLIADLLSLARADAGTRLEFGPVELDALLVEVVRRQHQAWPDLRMLVTRVETALVDGDADRLRELLGILLDNAARYTPAGGTVSAGLEVHGAEAAIVIEDTGIGLDEAELDHLFERLYRGRRAREMRPSGTGLGLTIAHWIVDSHGGSISLANRPRGGTVVTVALPRATGR